MSTIRVPTNKKEAVRKAYAAWRPARGSTSVAQLPEGAETGTSVDFSWVPEEFLAILDEAGVPYSKID
ncbi:hypothetical protein SBC1_80930 (plasmid) [Caballeronia sp. SBC1]|uniref:hypothetical protein n=1 Tax=Caballeronia sp. SBC1 TaxID=2705548 RepID=UPI00140C7A59|nr:hypothetical protein [Caballeronia sp. SBC1]QIN68046.1 hypothetical protein SBC1_80930 [Caballeronia sp. SBC1]